MSKQRKTGSADARRRRSRSSRGRAADAAACLSEEDLAKLSIDAWEPSLLRHLLEAQNKLPQSR